MLGRMRFDGLFSHVDPGLDGVNCSGPDVGPGSEAFEISGRRFVGKNRTDSSADENILFSAQRFQLTGARSGDIHECPLESRSLGDYFIQLFGFGDHKQFDRQIYLFGIVHRSKDLEDQSREHRCLENHAALRRGPEARTGNEKRSLTNGRQARAVTQPRLLKNRFHRFHKSEILFGHQASVEMQEMALENHV